MPVSPSSILRARELRLQRCPMTLRRKLNLRDCRDFQALNTKHAQEISQSMVGSIQRVLVVGKAKRGENMLSARTDNNRIVTFNGDESLIGKMISLKITDVYPHTLGGEIHE